MKKKSIFLMLCSLLITLGAVSQEYFSNVDNTEDFTVLKLAEKDKNFSTFMKFFKQSGLDVSTEYVDGFTIFMPVNEAFEEMKVGELEKLSNKDNQLELIEFIKSYVIPGKVYRNQFNNSQIIESSEDKSIAIGTDMNGQNVTVGGASIIESDIEAKNGVIHVIDALITPTTDFVRN